MYNTTLNPPLLHSFLADLLQSVSIVLMRFIALNQLLYHLNKIHDCIFFCHFKVVITHIHNLHYKYRAVFAIYVRRIPYTMNLSTLVTKYTDILIFNFAPTTNPNLTIMPLYK